MQRGVLLGIAAGLGFGISDVAIKALSGDLDSPAGLLSPWSAIIVTAAVFSFYASARSLQIGDGGLIDGHLRHAGPCVRHRLLASDDHPPA